MLGWWWTAKQHWSWQLVKIWCYWWNKQSQVSEHRMPLVKSYTCYRLALTCKATLGLSPVYAVWCPFHPPSLLPCFLSVSPALNPSSLSQIILYPQFSPFLPAFLFQLPPSFSPSFSLFHISVSFSAFPLFSPLAAFSPYPSSLKSLIPPSFPSPSLCLSPISPSRFTSPPSSPDLSLYPSLSLSLLLFSTLSFFISLIHVLMREVISGIYNHLRLHRKGSVIFFITGSKVDN